MSFLAPKILYWLLALPVLAGFKAWADWRARRVQAAFAAPRLREALVSGVSSGRSWFIFCLQILALACFIIALARPWWDEDKVVQQESGRNVIIAIDSSRSMLANDVVPDRLTRAKLAAQDLMLSLKDDRVGLIAFAGNAYLQAPLTTDHDAVVEAIQSIDFTSVPRGGSELGRAL
jgi:Ca-activated chloride channel family protein